MLHALIGTKGQLIKMIPVLKELEKRGIEYNFINAGQHSKILEKLVNLYGLKKPDVYLDKREKDILTASQAVTWLIKSSFKGIVKKNEIWKNDKGIVLVHGDAPPVMVGLIAGKLTGKKIAHIEAGLRSYDYFNPFPEELFRVLVDKFGDYLFAPTQWAADNLKKMKVKGKVFNTQLNTIYDTIKLSLELDLNIEIPEDPFIVASIHRFETIHSRETLKKALGVVKRAARDKKVIYVLHSSTEEKLKKYDLMEYLKDTENLEIRPILQYPYFIKLINNAEYVITDGGGLQEETFYLNKPCLILRRKTERIEGLNENICLSGFEEEKINDFLKNYGNYKTKSITKDYSPSEYIVDILLKMN